MQFSSDNWAGAHPRIVEAIGREAQRTAAAYGRSETDQRVADKFCELFGRQVSVFFVGTGTAANSIALAAAARPGGLVLCHPESHIEMDEAGAVAHQADGLRLMGVPGECGKFDATALRERIERFPARHIQAGQLSAVSVTQATEAGTTYGVGELAEIVSVAHEAGLPVHMDGARFANAVCALGTTPQAVTVDCSIDMLSFGATKNGCLSAEAVVLFDPAFTAELPYLRLRAGHLFSKSRFIAAQFEAYLEDGLWLELAAHANAMADRLREAVVACGRARLAWPTSVNEVFVVMSRQDAERCQNAGAAFYEWPSAFTDCAPEESVYRLVASFTTKPDEVDRFADLLNRRTS